MVVASVIEQEVAGEVQKRQRGRGGTGGGAGRGVEREQGEAAQCLEEAKEANGEMEQVVPLLKLILQLPSFHLC